MFELQHATTCALKSCVMASNEAYNPPIFRPKMSLGGTAGVVQKHVTQAGLCLTGMGGGASDPLSWESKFVTAADFLMVVQRQRLWVLALQFTEESSHEGWFSSIPDPNPSGVGRGGAGGVAFFFGVYAHS